MIGCAGRDRSGTCWCAGRTLSYSALPPPPGQAPGEVILYLQAKQDGDASQDQSTARRARDRAPPPPPPPPLDDFAISLLEIGAVLRLTYIDGWTHRLALRRPWPAVPDFLALVQMAEFMALPVDLYSRRSVADAQKTVWEQVRGHVRLVSWVQSDARLVDLN